MNIFTSENLMKYWNTSVNGVGHGEWDVLNGENAIRINPSRFRKNDAQVQVFKDEFLPNTNYIFNLYINMDRENLSYTGTASSGIKIYYSNGDTKSLTLKPTDTPKGWQNLFLITTQDVAYIVFHYGANYSVRYRWDSYIMPVTEDIGITAPGVFNTGTLVNADSASIQKGGVIAANNFYEF